MTTAQLNHNYSNQSNHTQHGPDAEGTALAEHTDATDARDETPYQEPEFDNVLEAFTDVGNARRLATNYSHTLRYVPAWGWLAYDHGRWRRDSGQQVVTASAKETVRQMARYGLDTTDAHEQPRWLGHAKQSFNRIGPMIESARTEAGLAANPGQFDADPWLLNTHNAVLDLRSGNPCTPLAPAPHRLLTKQAHADYAPEATAPTWQRFLNDIFCGDTALIAWIQKALGYALTGETREQCFFIGYGGGANGKSTLLETVRYVLGDYAAPVKADALMEAPFHSGDAPDPSLAALVGTRFVTAQEPHERGKDKAPTLDSARIKAMTGGDTLQVRELYGKAFSFTPQCKIWLATNTIPAVLESNEGIWRRVRLIPFNASFREERADRELPDKLRAEASGILNWLLEGVRRWRTEGLGDVPAAIRDATSEYRHHEDEYYEFFSNVLVPTDGQSVLLEDAWGAFMRWKGKAPYGTNWVHDSRQLGRIAERHGLMKRRGTRGEAKGRYELVGCAIATDYTDSDDEPCANAA